MFKTIPDTIIQVNPSKITGYHFKKSSTYGDEVKEQSNWNIISHILFGTKEKITYKRCNGYTFSPVIVIYIEGRNPLVIDWFETDIEAEIWFENFKKWLDNALDLE